jgi:hypothetical protein
MSDLGLTGVVRNFQEKLPSWAQSVIVAYVLTTFSVLTIPSPINHFSMIDPIIYQSYIHDYRYMVEIFGYTYYSTRVAWILPASLFQHVFGEGVGYLLVRILLLGGAASALSILVNRLFRRPYGVYAAAWIAFSPALLREMTHDYGDGAALCYAIVGLACILTRKDKAGFEHFWGGIFLGLAFNTYPTAAVLPIIAAPAWIVLRRNVALRSNFVCAASAALGFVAIFLLISTYLWSVFTGAGQAFEFIPLSTIKSLSTGGSAVWQVPLSTVFLGHGDWSRAYPLFVFAAIVIFLATKARVPQASSPEGAREQDSLVVAGILCGAAVVLYLGLHFGLHAGAIVWPWTYDYVLPACALGSIGLVCAVIPPRYDRWAVGLGAGLLIAPYLFGVFNGGLPYVAPMLWLVAGFAMSGAVLLLPIFNRKPLLMGVVAAAALLIFPLAFYSPAAFGSCGSYKGEVAGGRLLPVAPAYAGCLFRPNGLPFERDLQTGTLALMDEVKRVDPVDPPGLWYANNSGFADEVGSAYLWQYSRIGSTSSGDPGMPNLDAFAKSQIDKYNTLVLIGASQREIDTAKQALASSGYTLESRAQGRVGGRRFSFQYAILYKNPIDPKLYADGPTVDLTSASAQNGAQVDLRPDGLHLRTPRKTWSYAVFLPLTQAVTLDTTFIEVDLTVESGAIGADILPVGRDDFVGKEIRVRAHGQAQKIYVPVSFYDRPRLVLRNISSGESTAVVHSVRLVQKRTVPDKP